MEVARFQPYPPPFCKPFPNPDGNWIPCLYPSHFLVLLEQLWCIADSDLVCLVLLEKHLGIDQIWPPSMALVADLLSLAEYDLMNAPMLIS